ncbi:MAG: hypothetical protein JWQ98_1653 [Chlorobi bacterium]|nr:hypothetical protein [Chlorobiota bacterium]
MKNPQEDSLAQPISWDMPKERHCIVNVTFHGMRMKQIQIHDSAGNVVADRRNCTGFVCGDIVLRGSEDHEQWFTLNAYCAENECGQVFMAGPAVLRVSGPVGSHEPFTPPWVQTYLFHTGPDPESAVDTIGITIIVQVGIDPTTDGVTQSRKRNALSV